MTMKHIGTYLVNVQDIQLCLLHGLLDKARKLGEYLARQQLISGPVDGRAEVNAVRKTFDADASISTETQSLFRCFALQLQLGQSSRVLPRVSLVLLDKLLGEVVDNNLVQLGSSQLVVMGSSQDRVHASARRNDSDIRSRTTQVRHDNQFICDYSLRPCIVCQNCRNRLMDELKHLDFGRLRGSDQSFALRVREVRWDGDNCSIDVLAEEIRRRLFQATQVTGCDLRDGDRVGFLAGRVTYRESHSGIALLGVRGQVACGWIYRLKAACQVSITFAC